MSKAATILFSSQNANPLFTSQLDLVTALLNDSDTAYFVNEKDFEKYQKAQTRLKTYVSQLLSSNVARSITEDFKHGLLTVISKRSKLSPEKTEILVTDILTDLREKNAANSKNDIKSNNGEDQFSSDIDSAHYLAVITSKPLEIELPDRGTLLPLRRYLFDDLISRLYDPNKDLKYYRFNFPISSYGFLFWRGLRRILCRYFEANPSEELIESLYQKFAIKTDTLVDISHSLTSAKYDIKKIVNETLERLNRNRYILVFTSTAPIYGLPIIVMEPSDNRKIKVYAMLDTESDRMNLLKFSESDTLLWRLFVWDQLKSKKYAGEEVKYSVDI